MTELLDFTRAGNAFLTAYLPTCNAAARQLIQQGGVPMLPWVTNFTPPVQGNSRTLNNVDELVYPSYPDKPVWTSSPRFHIYFIGRFRCTWDNESFIPSSDGAGVNFYLNSNGTSGAVPWREPGWGIAQSFLFSDFQITNDSALLSGSLESSVVWTRTAIFCGFTTEAGANVPGSNIRLFTNGLLIRVPVRNFVP